MKNFMRLRGQKSLEYVWQRLGWPGCLGVALVGLSLVFYFMWALPQQQTTHALRHQTRELQQQWQALTSQGAKSGRSNTLPAWEELPRIGETTLISAQLLQIAQKTGVTVAEADFTLTPASAKQLATYRIDLSVQGSYLNLRQFMAAGLNTLPALALTQVSFKRDEVNANPLNTRLGFVVYLRP